jgi:uncharacterized protein YkwD
MKLLVAVILTCFVLFSSCAEFGWVQSAPNANAATSGNTIEDEILVQINQYRKSKKLSALKLNTDIITEARKHSRDMANNSVAFGHGGFQDRAKRLQSKISGFKGVAENVAYGQRNATEVVAGWIASPGHKVNIEGNYTQTGIGVVANKKGVLYYTQIFVR